MGLQSQNVPECTTKVSGVTGTLRMPRHALDVGTLFLSPSPREGRVCQSVGRSILRRGGQALLSETLCGPPGHSRGHTCTSQNVQLSSCDGYRLGVGDRLPRTTTKVHLELTLKLLLPSRLACLTSARHLGRGWAYLYSCFHRLTVLAQPDPMDPANAECYDLRSQKWPHLRSTSAFSREQGLISTWSVGALCGSGETKQL